MRLRGFGRDGQEEVATITALGDVLKKKGERQTSDYTRCNVCRGGISLIEPALDGRPQFKCTGTCGQTFTCGMDGGEWMKVALLKRRRPDA